MQRKILVVLRLVPEFLEAYFGSNNDGVTIRRFAIIEPVKEDLEAKKRKEEEDRKEKERPKTALMYFNKTIELWTIDEFSKLAKEEIEKLDLK